MKMSMLSGGLIAAGLFVSATALSSDVTPVVPVTVLQFNFLTQTLVAQSAEGSAVVLLHTPTTAHPAATIGEGNHPPDPCFGLAVAWNGVVADSVEDQDAHVVAFETLLAFMGILQCSADVTAAAPTTEGGLPTLVSIAPLVL